MKINVLVVTVVWAHVLRWLLLIRQTANAKLIKQNVWGAEHVHQFVPCLQLHQTMNKVAKS